MTDAYCLENARVLQLLRYQLLLKPLTCLQTVWFDAADEVRLTHHESLGKSC